MTTSTEPLTTVKIPWPILDAIAHLDRTHLAWLDSLDNASSQIPSRMLLLAFESLIARAARCVADDVAPYGCRLLYEMLARLAKAYLAMFNDATASLVYSRKQLGTPELSQSVLSAWDAVKLAAAKLQTPIERRQIESIAELHDQRVPASQIALIHGLDADYVIRHVCGGKPLPSYYRDPADRQFREEAADRFKVHDARDIVELNRGIRKVRERIDAHNENLEHAAATAAA